MNSCYLGLELIVTERLILTSDNKCVTLAFCGRVKWHKYVFNFLGYKHINAAGLYANPTLRCWSVLEQEATAARCKARPRRALRPAGLWEEDLPRGDQLESHLCASVWPGYVPENSAAVCGSSSAFSHALLPQPTPFPTPPLSLCLSLSLSLTAAPPLPFHSEQPHTQGTRQI